MNNPVMDNQHLAISLKKIGSRGKYCYLATYTCKYPTVPRPYADSVYTDPTILKK